MKYIVLAIVFLFPMSVACVEVEKDDGTTFTVDGETEKITIAGQAFTLWHVPVGEAEIEVFSSVPEKYRGAMMKVSAGEPLRESEAIAVLVSHYKHTAIDSDSIKLRAVTLKGPRYMAYCAAGFGCNHAFRGGTLVELEVNGRNRMGGMTGFESEQYLITKVSLAASESAGVATEQVDGRAPRATADELRKSLSTGVTIKSEHSPEEVLGAARTILEADGYVVGPFDPATGSLYTEVREIKLTSNHADCGKKWGMGYIGDKRTETTVLVAVSAKNGAVTVQAGVGGILRVNTPFGAGAADVTLTCNSNGALEQEIATKLAAALQ
jgi:hypothetical protein